jgi:transcriptional regulator with XRE-family HTH domain
MVESVSDSPVPESADSRLGMNVRRLRDKKGMTQAALAEAMTERGWQWHQSTVARVESGQQSVRFAEAEALIQILGTTLDMLTLHSEEGAEMHFAAACNGRLRASWTNARIAIAQLEDARAALQKGLKRWQDSQYERVRKSAAGLAEELEDCTVESAVAEGIALSKHEASGASPG